MQPVRVHIGAQGDVDIVVLALAERGALPLALAHDGVHVAIDANLLADRVFAAQQVLHHVVAHDGDVRAFFLIGLSELAAGYHHQARSSSAWRASSR